MTRRLSRCVGWLVAAATGMAAGCALPPAAQERPGSAAPLRFWTLVERESPDAWKAVDSGEIRVTQLYAVEGTPQPGIWAAISLTVEYNGGRVDRPRLGRLIIEGYRDILRATGLVPTALYCELTIFELASGRYVHGETTLEAALLDRASAGTIPPAGVADAAMNFFTAITGGPAR